MVLAPRDRVLDSSVLGSLRRTVVRPWNPGRIELLASISDALIRHPRLRRDPAAVALGFWLRRANLAALQRSWQASADSIRVATGMVFHVTPANVDTMFVYSWALSFLAGNANVVRLTSRLSPLMVELLDVIAAAFSQYLEASHGNWFVSFEHSDAVSERFSVHCDLRVIWGGDETVRRLRAVPLNPHASERCFASKRSFSVFNTAAYRALTKEQRIELAIRVAGDIQPFGQMACSSPHEIVWVGETSEGREAVALFQQSLDDAMVSREAGVDIGSAVRRLNSGFALAAAGVASSVVLGQASAGYEVARIENLFRDEPCGAGMLAHAFVGDLGAVSSRVASHHQTITHFGFERSVIETFAAEAGSAGADRIVPVGEALAFSAHWDGFDLWADFTRSVSIR